KTMVAPMTLQSAPSSGVAMLKWLRRPRTTWPTITAISIMPATAMTVPAHQPPLRPRRSRVSSQARVSAYTVNDTANLNGLSQIGAPTRTRSSTIRPPIAMTVRTGIAPAKYTSGRCQRIAVVMTTGSPSARPDSSVRGAHPRPPERARPPPEEGGRIGDMTVPSVTLVGDIELPGVGLGPWRLHGRQAYDAVRYALDTGYRHLDTATMYGNELQVGQALRDSGVDRDEVFLTTKLLPRNAGRERATIEASLRDLGVERVDLWLIHWPPRSGAGLATWREFLA